MNIFCLAVLSVAGAAGQERVLDAFDYRGGDPARQAWKAAEGTPSLDVATEDGAAVTRIQAPFAESRRLSRVVFDRDVQLDLSAPGEFTLEVRGDHPEAIAHATLYFRSGAGWYGANAGLARPGWQQLRFRKADFRVEDSPAGWSSIQGIRIAFWRGESKDAAIDLRRLAALTHDVAIVTPAAIASRDPGEGRIARETAGRIAELLAELGLATDEVEDSALAGGALANRQLAILPLNPALSSDAADALADFVRRGGKLLVCYTLPDRLAPALGFRSSQFLRQERPGQFAEIRFDALDIPGLPKSVKQASWNIYVAEAVGQHARVIGQWCDDGGRPTGRPAMLLSDTGAFLSHIVLSDDPQGKKQMLAAVLGKLCPSLWPAMARSTLDQAAVVGHHRSLDQLLAQLNASSSNQARQGAVEAAKTMRRAEQEFKDADYPQAVELARQAHDSLVAAYLLAQPSPAAEGRAMWNHSGTGAYDGDWERSAKNLTSAGFNMILPNMLWGGVAHYDSKVLPRSRTFAEHGDQIQQCVAAAKRHGLEVHVWKVNWNLGSAPKPFVEDMRRQERLQVSVRGEPVNWLCPSHPENQRLELDSLLEVARNYPVDGLHFDYIRYPDRDSCYCDGCRRRFEAATGRKIQSWPSDAYSGQLRDEYNDWRCDQITKLVAAVHREAKKLRPELKISAAVFGGYPNCRESVAQDWPAWVKAGYLDFICPMDYTNDDGQFAQLASSQLKLIGGRIPCYPGIGATASRSNLAPDQVIGQIHQARQLGAGGFTIFNYSAATAESIVPAVGQSAGVKKAAPPHDSSTVRDPATSPASNPTS